ncbi:MAG TPA: beta-propeller fold lactonase family protein [Leptospiraceae bacterium]|nr:beta-propeller fold lactonase family protein [Leptospiraceae bacterium]
METSTKSRVRTILVAAFGFVLLCANCRVDEKCNLLDPSCNGWGLLASFKINQQYLYITTGTASGTIQGFSVDNFTGAITAVPSATVTGLNIPRGIVASPGGKYLYVAVTTGGTIQAYSINPQTGGLTLIQSIALANAYELAVDPLGRYLFATNNAGVVTEYVIQSNGSLSVGTTGATSSPNVIPVVDTLGRYLYVGSQPGATLDGFTIQSSGALGSTIAFNTTGGRTDFVATAGNYLYVTDLAFSLVRAYSLSASSPTPALISSGSNTTTVNYLVAHPALLACYTLHSGSNAIYVLPLAANGGVTNGTAFNAGYGVSGMTIETTGRFAYVVGGANILSIYAIGSGGSLSTVGTTTVGTTPVRAAIAAIYW